MHWNHQFIFINCMNCFQSLFLIQKILLSVSLAWSQRKARFPIPRLRAVLFPWDSVTGRMQPLNSGNIKILTAIKKLWSEKLNSPINKRHWWSSLSSPFRGKIIQLTAVANGSMQHQVFLPERDCQSVAMCCVMSTVNANIISKKVRAVYTHCYGHALKLAVGDSVKRLKWCVIP